MNEKKYLLVCDMLSGGDELEWFNSEDELYNRISLLENNVFCLPIEAYELIEYKKIEIQNKQ
jgi:hypothetical protein